MTHMRDLIQSAIRFSWTMALLGIKQLGSAFFSSNQDAQPGPISLHGTDTFHGVRGPVKVATAPPLAPSGPEPLEIASLQSRPSVRAGTNPQLDATRFIVLGEGLAAGVGDFTLTSDTQQWSFPAQMARQMGVDFRLPLLQSPGIGNFVGFPPLPVRIPAPMQTTVFAQLPPQPVANIAAPEFKLNDALNLRPSQPLVHRSNTRQTAANLIWGILPIAQGQTSLPTQLEYALQRSPSFTIVELGYYEILEAAINQVPDQLPSPEEFISQYAQILAALKNCGSKVLVLNIPDPFSTAHFSTVEIAARVAKVEPAFLIRRYGIQANDLITLEGLNEIGFQIFNRSLAALPPRSLVPAATVSDVRRGIDEINRGLAELAAENDALLYDLAGLFRRVAAHGYPLAARTLTRDYLGGFYTLNGYYPGQTGQAIIANEILGLLNETYGTRFPLIDLNLVASGDPSAACRPAFGPIWPSMDLEQLPFNPNPEPSQWPNLLTEQNQGSTEFSVNDNWRQLAPVDFPSSLPSPLRLPPGLEQVLPLNTSASYFGDGISALNVRTQQETQFGSTADFLFGGLAMVDSHLSGSIRIKFSPPLNNASHFEVSFMGGFTGENSVLVTPQFFKMGFQQCRVDEFPGLTSSGDLDLETGQVSNLTIYAQYSATALLALIGVNPTFPKPAVIIFKNPPPSNCPPPTPEQQRIYASAQAEFAQRPDGKLDFTFYGSMFIPLGPGIVWPLNFAGPSREFALVPAAGTVMHPHLRLSTREPENVGADVSDLIPFNTVQEFTLFTHNSAFGDAFTLNAPHLGGPAKGRSHLLGRLQIQFGPKTGNSAPMAVWAIPPGGIMAPLAPSPVTQVFPSRIPPGPQGFNENLRFPMRTYALDDLSVLDDPFDISVGALDLQTGRTLDQLLHRGFISQDLIFALLRVEPCTPQSSFFFRGPAVLVRGPHNQRVFRFQGIVHIPYPQGFKFPHPDFATGFTVGGNSALDPFLWFHASQNGVPEGIVLEGSARSVRASTGDEFSYRYLIPSDPSSITPMFEYENLTQQGSFRMHSLAWVDFGNSGTSHAFQDKYDTVTFSGFGFWRKDGIKSLQQVAVQISRSPEKPFVGIQVAEGDISNVNTKPQNEMVALP